MSLTIRDDENTVIKKSGTEVSPQSLGQPLIAQNLDLSLIQSDSIILGRIN